MAKNRTKDKYRKQKKPTRLSTISNIKNLRRCNYSMPAGFQYYEDFDKNIDGVVDVLDIQLWMLEGREDVAGYIQCILVESVPMPPHAPIPIAPVNSFPVIYEDCSFCRWANRWLNVCDVHPLPDIDECQYLATLGQLWDQAIRESCSDYDRAMYGPASEYYHTNNPWNHCYVAQDAGWATCNDCVWYVEITDDCWEWVIGSNQSYLGCLHLESHWGCPYQSIANNNQEQCPQLSAQWNDWAIESQQCHQSLQILAGGSVGASHCCGEFNESDNNYLNNHSDNYCNQYWYQNCDVCDSGLLTQWVDGCQDEINALLWWHNCNQTYSMDYCQWVDIYSTQSGYPLGDCITTLQNGQPIYGCNPQPQPFNSGFTPSYGPYTQNLCPDPCIFNPYAMDEGDIDPWSLPSCTAFLNFTGWDNLQASWNDYDNEFCDDCANYVGEDGIDPYDIEPVRACQCAQSWGAGNHRCNSACSNSGAMCWPMNHSLCIGQPDPKDDTFKGHSPM